MSRSSDLQRILERGIVAVVRSPDSGQLVEVARALADGGVDVVEITMSVPNALDVLRQVRQVHGDRLLLGAGTVLDSETARAVLLAGADIVKVFPADVVGPAFFKAMRGPLPQIRLMPTGGVDLNTAAAFLQAGACCLGVGGQLVEPKAVAERDFDRIRALARQYASIIQKSRAEK